MNVEQAITHLRYRNVINKERFTEAIDILENEINRQKAEIERLLEERTLQEIHIENQRISEKHLMNQNIECAKRLSKVRAEAYREFAERFKQRYDKPLFYLGSYEQFMCEVDNLVKELTENNE